MRIEALSKYLANDKAENVGTAETPANTLITGARAIIQAIENAEPLAPPPRLFWTTPMARQPTLYP